MKIALIAHDKKKDDIVQFSVAYEQILAEHELFATGTTGLRIMEATDLTITRFRSGPLGGDQQIGAMIAEKKIDILIFFWDPLNAVPHDPDVKALLRLATVWNIPVATNRATANFLISSPLFSQESKIKIPDYEGYLKERLK